MFANITESIKYLTSLLKRHNLASSSSPSTLQQTGPNGFRTNNTNSSYLNTANGLNNHKHVFSDKLIGLISV